MNLSQTISFSLTIVLLLADVLSHPARFPEEFSDVDEQIEDRRRKHKRKKRPCAREDPSTARWFFGHDLTLYLGDVTIVSDPCGYTGYPSKPQHDEDILSRPGLFGGQKPNKPGLFGGQKPNKPGSQLFGNKPHRPLGGHKPGLLDNNRPLLGLFGNRPFKPESNQNEYKPVHEIIDEDEQQAEYRPGVVVGAPSAQIDGHDQDLTHFSASGILTQISRHFNRIVDPFIDLFT